MLNSRLKGQYMYCLDRAVASVGQGRKMPPPPLNFEFSNGSVVDCHLASIFAQCMGLTKLNLLASEII